MPAAMSEIEVPTRVRAAVRPTRRVHDPGERLDHGVVGGLIVQRAVLTEAGDGADDQRSVLLDELLRVEPELRHHAGTEVLDDHIGAGRSSTSRGPGRRDPSGRARCSPCPGWRTGSTRMMPSSANGPICRVSSPLPGRSILMTRAPASASIRVQVGPASTRVKSTTVMPSRACGFDGSRCSRRSAGHVLSS